MFGHDEFCTCISENAPWSVGTMKAYMTITSGDWDEQLAAACPAEREQMRQSLSIEDLAGVSEKMIAVRDECVASNFRER